MFILYRPYTYIHTFTLTSGANTVHVYNTDLLNKGLVEEVRASNAEIQDVDFLQDGIVEGVQKPGGVGDLVIGEHSKDVEVGIGCKP